jgi:hypothetical protein
VSLVEVVRDAIASELRRGRTDLGTSGLSTFCPARGTSGPSTSPAMIPVILLKVFASTLAPSFSIVDLRDAPIGFGFSWGRHGPDTVVPPLRRCCHPFCV